MALPTNALRRTIHNSEMTTDADMHELAAAYALDALDDEERRAFEAHLDACALCRGEVASFGDAVLALAAGAAGDDAPAPAAGLRERILDAARVEPPNVVPIAVARERRRGTAAFLQPRVLAPALTVAAAAAVALGIWGAGVSGSLDRERAARRADASALAAFSDPAAARGVVQNASLVVARGRGALSVAKLPPAPAGKTYQAWVIPPGEAPIPAGLFDARGGRAVIVLGPTVGPGAIVAITLERAGGAATPTTKPLLAVTAAQL